MWGLWRSPPCWSAWCPLKAWRRRPQRRPSRGGRAFDRTTLVVRDNAGRALPSRCFGFCKQGFESRFASFLLDPACLFLGRERMGIGYRDLFVTVRLARFAPSLRPFQTSQTSLSSF